MSSPALKYPYTTVSGGGGVVIPPAYFEALVDELGWDERPIRETMNEYMRRAHAEDPSKPLVQFDAGQSFSIDAELPGLSLEAAQALASDLKGQGINAEIYEVPSEAPNNDAEILEVHSNADRDRDASNDATKNHEMHSVDDFNITKTKVDGETNVVIASRYAASAEEYNSRPRMTADRLKGILDAMGMGASKPIIESAVCPTCKETFTLDDFNRKLTIQGHYFDTLECMTQHVEGQDPNSVVDDAYKANWAKQKKNEMK